MHRRKSFGRADENDGEGVHLDDGHASGRAEKMGPLKPFPWGCAQVRNGGSSINARNAAVRNSTKVGFTSLLGEKMNKHKLRQ